MPKSYGTQGARELGHLLVANWRSVLFRHISSLDTRQSSLGGFGDTECGMGSGGQWKHSAMVTARGMAALPTGCSAGWLGHRMQAAMLILKEDFMVKNKMLSVSGLTVPD